jgi:hypothetical protein
VSWPVEMPCVGCKWAEWYPTADEYGQCRHPVAEELRKPRPMSVFSSAYQSVSSITRYWTLGKDTLPNCHTREAPNANP